MIRGLALLGLAAFPLWSQLNFSMVSESGDVPVTALVQLAPAAAGDTVDTIFRLRNAGKTNAPVTGITIGGTGFSLASLPDFPTSLAPGGSLDFIVRFRPPIAATYSSVLKSDGIEVFVLGTGIPVLSIYVDDNGSRRPLDTSAGLDFGAAERGTRATRRVVLANETGQPLTATLAIVGSVFQLPPGTPAIISLDPLTSASLDITYAPVIAGSQQGELDIDRRRFPLRGSTVEPPLSKPIVVLDLKGDPPASGAQPTAAVHFDPPPRTSGAGTLRLEFHPSVEAQDDPAIQFLSTASRSIDFTVIEGVADAQFGQAIAIPLQTGTTAGTIVLTARLGDWEETASIEIPPQPVAIDTVQLTRTQSEVAVQVNGYDNTRSLSAATFTFLQKDGTVLAPGKIGQDLGTVFKDYFANSTLGGSFQLKLSFPVTGNAAAVDSVQVTMTNSAGQTSWPAP